MNKIDKFIELMAQRGAERAVLYGDKPYTVWIEGRKIQGTIISSVQLRQILDEIIPTAQKSQLTYGGTFHFAYQSPSGVFDVGVEVFLDSIQASLAPSQVVEVLRLAPTPPLSPVMAPVVPTTMDLQGQQPIYCQKCGLPTRKALFSVANVETSSTFRYKRQMPMATRNQWRLHRCQ